MYKGVANSPETTITNNINETDTLIYVLDETRIPAELPNLMVLGTGTGAETIKVLSIEGNAITVERGFQGVAKAWNAGTVIARNFTEYDYNALKENIEGLDENIGDLDELDTTEKDNIVGAINEVVDDLDSHKAENVSYQTSISRDISITGEQIVSLIEGKTAKKVTIYACIQNGTQASWGVVSDAQVGIAQMEEGKMLTMSGTSIRLRISAGNEMVGIVTIQEGQIKINWTKTGTPTGTAYVFIFADYHD